MPRSAAGASLRCAEIFSPPSTAEGTWQATIPFQWSLHTVDGDGALSHKEFLADGVNDPRRKFGQTLIDALASSADPIIVYSAYEQTRLKELAVDFPDLSAALNGLIAQLVDLLPIVRSAVYFPAQQMIARNMAPRDGDGLSPALDTPYAF